MQPGNLLLCDENFNEGIKKHEAKSKLHKNFKADKKKNPLVQNKTFSPDHPSCGCHYHRTGCGKGILQSKNPAGRRICRPKESVRSQSILFGPDVIKIFLKQRRLTYETALLFCLRVLAQLHFGPLPLLFYLQYQLIRRTIRSFKYSTS